MVTILGVGDLAQILKKVSGPSKGKSDTQKKIRKKSERTLEWKIRHLEKILKKVSGPSNGFRAHYRGPPLSEISASENFS